MLKDDQVRLRHMLDASREARAFTASKARKNLDTDRMLTLALVKCIEIVGEAANRVSEDFRQQHTQIPWADIIGMRHRLIHGYYDINLDILWRTITTNLPALITTLEQLVTTDRVG